MQPRRRPAHPRRRPRRPCLVQLLRRPELQAAACLEEEQEQVRTPRRAQRPPHQPRRRSRSEPHRQPTRRRNRPPRRRSPLAPLPPPPHQLRRQTPPAACSRRRRNPRVPSLVAAAEHPQPTTLRRHPRARPPRPRRLCSEEAQPPRLRVAVSLARRQAATSARTKAQGKTRPRSRRPRSALAARQPRRRLLPLPQVRGVRAILPLSRAAADCTWGSLVQQHRP